MLYKQYKERIERIKKAVVVALILTVIAVVIGAVLLSAWCVAGYIRGEITKQPKDCTVTYGSAVNPGAEGRFTSVDYEFADKDGKWVKELPDTLGEHKARGYTVNKFGKTRYTDEITVTVIKRDVSIFPKQLSFVYGDIPELTAECVSGENLKSGDYIASASVSLLSYDAGETEAEISENSLVIKNSSGMDVTDCYNIILQTGKCTVLPREITVTTGSGEKEYDGKALTVSESVLTKGSLVEGHTLNAKCISTHKNAGTADNTADFSITDEQNRDVTKNYSITAVWGKLTVTPRPLEFKTESGEKVYDGIPLTVNKYSLVSGSVVEGQSLKVTVTGSQTDAGTGDNTLAVQVFGAEGETTDNYTITVNAGKLTVNKRKLVLRTNSGDKLYDGTELQVFGYNIVSGSLAPEQRMEVAYDGFITNAGIGKNTLIVNILKNDDNENVTRNYQITVNAGKLTVRKRDITFSSLGAQKPYDGTPLFRHEYNIIKGYMPRPTNVIGNYTGSQTKVGSSPNYFTVQLTDMDTNEDVTGNYNITYVYGTLTVTPADQNNGGDSGGDIGGDIGGDGGGDVGGDGGGDVGGDIGSGGGNAGATTPNSSEITGISSSGFDGLNTSPVFRVLTGLSGTFYFRGTSYGDYTGSGFIKAPEYYEDFFSYAYTAGILREKGVDEHVFLIETLTTDFRQMLSGYYMDSVDRDIVVGEGQIKFKAPVHNYSFWGTSSVKLYFDEYEFDEKEYAYSQFVKDNYLSLPEGTRSAMLKIAKENGLSQSSGIYEIAEYIQGAATYRLDFADFPKGCDMAVHFLTQSREGICQHYAMAATVMYRALGIPARYVVGFVADTVSNEWSNVTGDRAHAWVEVYVDGFGWLPVEVTGHTSGGGGISGGNIYLEQPEPRQKLQLTSYSATKVYDGKRLKADGYYISGGKLLEGHTLKAVCNPEYIVNVGTARNSFELFYIIDEKGKDVTDKYDVEMIEGTLTILPRVLEISTGSAFKAYDGKPLTNKEYWISQGSLVKNQELYLDMPASITRKGIADNYFANVRIINIYGSDETENYIIVAGKMGTLTVY